PKSSPPPASGSPHYREIGPDCILAAPVICRSCVVLSSLGYSALGRYALISSDGSNLHYPVRLSLPCRDCPGPWPRLLGPGLGGPGLGGPRPWLLGSGLGRAAAAAALLPAGAPPSSATAATATTTGSATPGATEPAGALSPPFAAARRSPRPAAFRGRHLRLQGRAKMARRGASADRHRSAERRAARTDDRKLQPRLSRVPAELSHLHAGGRFRHPPLPRG